MQHQREVGSNRTRREDAGLITGQTKFTDDIVDTPVVHAAILRSQFGHARILNIDTNAAKSIDGVIDVFTAADIAASGTKGAIRVPASLAKTLPDSIAVPNQKSTELPLLATDRVRFVGQPVAVAIAEDRYTAREAANKIEVNYERLPAVVDVDEALADDAPVLHDEFDDNVALDWTFGDTEAVDSALAEADHVVELENYNQRLIPNALEPRACVVDPHWDDDRLFVQMNTQVPHRARGRLSQALGINEDKIRVKAPAVGGGFGSKGNRPYPEEPLAAWCALQLDQPVKWIGTRTESHQADYHGRDIYTHGKLALDSDGKIQAYHIIAKLNLGGYLGWEFTPAMNFQHQLSNLYDIPYISGHFMGAFANKAPVGPYRGAGTPNAVVLMERMIDQAAKELEIDPAEIRRRNFISPEDFPFETAVHSVYDSGNYEPALDKALELVDYPAIRERQQQLREDNRYLGVGIGGFVKKTAVTFAPGICKIRFDEDAKVTAFCETADQGQGHETTFAQVLADEFAMSYDEVTIEEGDSDLLPEGLGTFACRSAPVGGSVLAKSAREIIEQARQLAGMEFEADPEDIEFNEGVFNIKGTPDRSITLNDLVELTYSMTELPDGIKRGFETTTRYDPEGETYPFGFHIAVVEVNPDSGEIDFQQYIAVDDVGVQLNPLLVESQIIGGISQGVGQALYEHGIYDASGTLQTSSFTDYTLPKALHLPEIMTANTVTPSPNNPLGVKGAGESGNNGAPPAVMNAVLDALAPLGIDHIDSPITPEKIWMALE